MLGAHLDGAAEVLDHGAYDVEADAAAGALGHLGLRREARREQEVQQGRPGRGGVDRQQAALDRDGANLVLVDAAAVVGHLDHHGRPGCARRDRHRRVRRLAGLDPLGRRLAAVVDGVGDQVPERVGDGVQHPGVELDVLAVQDQRDVLGGVVRSAGRRELADQLRETGHHPAQRHHRQAHRAVAHVGQPALPVLGPGEQLAGGGAELVAEGDQGVQGVEDLGLGRRTGQRLADRATGPLVVGGQRGELAAVPRDPAYVELGDADDVDQVVHPPGRHPDRVAAAAAQVVRLGQLLLGEPRHRSPGRHRRTRSPERRRRQQAPRHRPAGPRRASSG